MNHIPIVNTSNQSRILEFSHFSYDAPAGLWNREHVIMQDHIKINVFLEGSFSVFSDGVLHRPTYGDICLFSPMKMHYGQIKTSMYINYYQIDIGIDTFSDFPDGNMLIGRLIDLTAKDSFVRPDSKNKESVLRLCEEIESAIKREDMFFAYAKVAECLSLLYSVYMRASGSPGVAFSLRTSQTLNYIEKNFAEDVTIDRISNELGVSASFVSRVFKRELGITIHEYLNRYRVLKSIEFLKTQSVTETGYLCGFCDNSHFISVFKKYMNATPMQYKNSHYTK